MNNIAPINSEPTVSEIIQRGKDAQRKTIEGILEFSLCVVELKSNAEVKQGGTNFAELCADNWGLSEKTASVWYGIGMGSETLTQNVRLLPPSYATVYELTLLDKAEFQQGIAEGVITPEVTRAKVIAFRKQCNPSEPKPIDKTIKLSVKINSRSEVVTSIHIDTATNIVTLETASGSCELPKEVPINFSASVTA